MSSQLPPATRNRQAFVARSSASARVLVISCLSSLIRRGCGACPIPTSAAVGHPSAGPAMIMLMVVPEFARPRVLAWGLTDTEIELIKPLSGSLTVADPSEAHPEEHDVLIVERAEYFDHARGYPRRLSFARPPSDTAEKHPDEMWERAIQHDVRTYATTQDRPASRIVIADTARQLGLESLIERTCIPNPKVPYTGLSGPLTPTRDVRALVEEDLSSPMVLAAIFDLPGQDSEIIDSVLWLPNSARSGIADWLRLAMSIWRDREPQRFPESVEWETSDAWASPDEAAARIALRSFDQAESERARTIADQRRALEQQIEVAESSGANWRELVTETGDALVAAVKTTLEVFEFSIQEPDEFPAHKGKKREDLRVVDGEWTCLVEVKGHVGAAKSNDLSQVTRASVVFAMSELRAPDALWYVPNGYRLTDPAQRPVALAGREDDISAFANDHDGCVIDTRELFALRQAVVGGFLSPVEARGLLKEGRGRFDMNARLTSN